MSKLPLVYIKVQHGTSVVTLSTMGDTTHVQTDNGACFHIAQLCVDSVYFRPAKPILKQARQLERTEAEMAQSFQAVQAARYGIQALFKKHQDMAREDMEAMGLNTYIAEKQYVMDKAFDRLAKLEVTRIEVMRQRDELREEIKAQNYTYTEIFKG